MSTQNLTALGLIFLRKGIVACETLIVGARNDAYTLDALAAFVDQNPYGVIFIDEVNKLRNSHLREPWSSAVFNEVLALLDADQRLLASKKSGNIHQETGL